MPRRLFIDPRGWSRETRLLIVTIVLSLAVLVTLARFRFPAQQPLALPVQPLQQLAARAAFEDLSVAVSRATARVRPSLVVIARAPAVEIARSLAIDDVLRHDGGEPLDEYVLAIRFRRDLALALPGGRPLRLRAADARALNVQARDELKGLVVLRVPPAPDEWRPLSTVTASGPHYLLIAEALAGDVAMRPLFGGPVSELASPHWVSPLIVLGQQERASQGALVFGLDGSFIGAVARAGSATALVPADALLAAATEVAATPPRVPASLGIHLQALDAGLAAATGADYGVVVSAVDSSGAAATMLQPGDVITAIEDRAPGTPENALLMIAALDLAKSAALKVLRFGRPLTITVTPKPIGTTSASNVSDTLGVTVRTTSHGLVITDIEPASAAERAGLVLGDVITSLSGAQGVTSRRLTAAYASLLPGAHLVIGVERAGEPLVVALTRPER